MRIATTIILFVLVGLAFFTACKKPKVYPATPEIHFKEFQLKDSTDLLGDLKVGYLIFSFVDGDGDIGVLPSDTNTQYDSTDYNLFLQMYEKDSSGYTEVNLAAPLRYRIPYISASEGQNKTLKGDIWVRFSYYYPLEYDTIKYKFFITDRAGNKSNVDSTGVVAIQP